MTDQVDPLTRAAAVRLGSPASQGSHVEPASPAGLFEEGWFGLGTAWVFAPGAEHA